MPMRKSVIVLLVWTIAGITNAAFAQSGADQDKPQKTLLERLDDFGKTIFGRRSSSDDAKTKDFEPPKPEPRSLPRKPSTMLTPDDLDMRHANDGRAGSVLTGTGAAQRPAVDEKSAESEVDSRFDEATLAVPRAADGTPKTVRRPLSSPSLLDDDLPEITQRQAPLALPQKMTSGVSTGVQADVLESAGPSKPAFRPMYERLAAVRQSVFGDDKPQSTVQAGRIADATPGSDATIVKLLQNAESSVPKVAGRPLVAQRVKPDLGGEDAVTAEPLLGPPASSLTAGEKTPAANKPDNQGGVLFARKGPLLSIETTGPRRITVGKESTYEVSILNAGDVAAEDLVLYVSLPDSAEVAGTEASTGAVQVSAAGQPAGTVQWKLNRLDAKGRERLLLKIIPRQSHAFDLAVRWESKPVASQAMIEVQEPKLVLQWEGPHEVLYGKKEAYRLKLINTGNGIAENLAIVLKTVGAGQNVPATHRIGTLAAGGEKVLDVELTARQAGNLTIQVEAQADGVRAELSEKVLVRRAALKVDVEGPKVQFVGATAAYIVRVRNPGTAAARNVDVSAILPSGAKYLSGIEGARLNTSTNRLEWTIDAINPGQEQTATMKCSLAAAGANRVLVNVSAADDLSASAATVTQVETVANLVMDVKSPDGPVAVGEEATYEVRVRNRGTKDAETIEVFAYLSNGIEPTAAEGSPSRLGPGQVVFQPIKSLAPGAEAVLKVRVRAEVGGNHIFRVETHSQPLGARLVSEVTNLYYADASTGQPAGRAIAGDATVSDDPVRTVKRPAQGDKTPAPQRD